MEESQHPTVLSDGGAGGGNEHERMRVLGVAVVCRSGIEIAHEVVIGHGGAVRRGEVVQGLRRIRNSVRGIERNGALVGRNR